MSFIASRQAMSAHARMESLKEWEACVSAMKYRKKLSSALDNIIDDALIGMSATQVTLYLNNIKFIGTEAVFRRLMPLTHYGHHPLSGTVFSARSRRSERLPGSCVGVGFFGSQGGPSGDCRAV